MIALSTASMLLWLPTISSFEKSAWLYQSVTLRNLRQPFLSSPKILINNNSTSTMTKSTTTNPSNFHWFQEMLYPNFNCQGEPYSTFAMILGDCLKDSPSTSFMFALTPDATLILSSAYSDDHCGAMSHNETEVFEGSSYDGPDSEAACIPNPLNAQPGNEFPTSIRTFAYKFPINQLTYPTGGQILSVFLDKDCNSKMVSSNWRSLDTCMTRSMADLDSTKYSNSKRFKFYCDRGYPDIHAYNDRECTVPSRSYPPHSDHFNPTCNSFWAPFNKFTPPGSDNSYVTTHCSGDTSSIISVPTPTSTPTTRHIETVLPSLLPIMSTSTISPTRYPIGFSGLNISSPVSRGGASNRNNNDNNSMLFLENSLPGVLLIIVIISGIAFCLCTGTLVFFLCLRLQSQDTLNRDLMQSFAQLVNRDSRALRSVQEKFSNNLKIRSQRQSHSVKLQEMEMRAREDRPLLSTKAESIGSRKRNSSRSFVGRNPSRLSTERQTTGDDEDDDNVDDIDGEYESFDDDEESYEIY